MRIGDDNMICAVKHSKKINIIIELKSQIDHHFMFSNCWTTYINAMKDKQIALLRGTAIWMSTLEQAVNEALTQNIQLL